MRTRIKFCGITRRQDALDAAECGVDAIGLVFYAPSPRAVTPAQARKIVEGLPPFVSVVALFVNAAREMVEEVIQTVHPDILQFHGDESAQECAAYGVPFYKAIRMHPEVDLMAEAQAYHQASALLLDTYQSGVAGGTGQAFEWARIPSQGLGLPLILAGGLEPANVEAAIAAVRPYAVDVSGGIEQAKGIKSQKQMIEFVRGVERADQSR